MDNIIRTEKLEFAYGASAAEPLVLRGIDLTIKKGAFVAVIGQNGSGKSTLARHFNALLLPVGGSVFVTGADTRDESMLLTIRRTVGMVFQNPDNQLVANVVEEDVAFAPENLGYPPEEIRRRVDDALKLVGMYEYRKHAPHLLSGGQKQRVAIAGALALEPECIVFDEPTAMLDPQGRESIVNIICELCEKHGVTVILITHHMDEAARADRVIVMRDGGIAMDGVPSEVFCQAEMLRGAGLDVPETVALLLDLNKNGFNLPPDALSVEECAQAIYMSMKEIKGE